MGHENRGMWIVRRIITLQNSESRKGRHQVIPSSLLPKRIPSGGEVPAPTNVLYSPAPLVPFVFSDRPAGLELRPILSPVCLIFFRTVADV